MKQVLNRGFSDRMTMMQKGHDHAAAVSTLVSTH